MYWPTVPTICVNKKLDAKGDPHIIQPYHVPTPLYNEYHRHDAALFSMWNYFVEFCVNNSVKNTEYSSPFQTKNRYTGKSRLDCFINLSQSQDSI